MTCGFSRVMGNCSCSSAAKLAMGDNVPLVSRMLRTFCLDNICIARPGRKHLEGQIPVPIPLIDFKRVGIAPLMTLAEKQPRASLPAVTGIIYSSSVGIGMRMLVPVAEGGSQGSALGSLLHVDVDSVGGCRRGFSGLHWLEGVCQHPQMAAQGLQALAARTPAGSGACLPLNRDPNNSWTA